MVRVKKSNRRNKKEYHDEPTVGPLPWDPFWQCVLGTEDDIIPTDTEGSIEDHHHHHHDDEDDTTLRGGDHSSTDPGDHHEEKQKKRMDRVLDRTANQYQHQHLSFDDTFVSDPTFTTTTTTTIPNQNQNHDKATTTTPTTTAGGMIESNDTYEYDEYYNPSYEVSFDETYMTSGDDDDDDNYNDDDDDNYNDDDDDHTHDEIEEDDDDDETNHNNSHNNNNNNNKNKYTRTLLEKKAKEKKLIELIHRFEYLRNEEMIAQQEQLQEQSREEERGGEKGVVANTTTTITESKEVVSVSVPTPTILRTIPDTLNDHHPTTTTTLSAAAAAAAAYQQPVQQLQGQVQQQPAAVVTLTRGFSNTSSTTTRDRKAGKRRTFTYLQTLRLQYSNDNNNGKPILYPNNKKQTKKNINDNNNADDNEWNEHLVTGSDTVVTKTDDSGILDPSVGTSNSSSVYAPSKNKRNQKMNHASSVPTTTGGGGSAGGSLLSPMEMLCAEEEEEDEEALEVTAEKFHHHQYHTNNNSNSNKNLKGSNLLSRKKNKMRQQLESVTTKILKQKKKLLSSTNNNTNSTNKNSTSTVKHIRITDEQEDYMNDTTADIGKKDEDAKEGTQERDNNDEIKNMELKPNTTTTTSPTTSSFDVNQLLHQWLSPTTKNGTKQVEQQQVKQDIDQANDDDQVKDEEKEKDGREQPPPPPPTLLLKPPTSSTPPTTPPLPPKRKNKINSNSNSNNPLFIQKRFLPTMNFRKSLTTTTGGADIQVPAVSVVEQQSPEIHHLQTITPPSPPILATTPTPTTSDTDLNDRSQRSRSITSRTGSSTRSKSLTPKPKIIQNQQKSVSNHSFTKSFLSSFTSKKNHTSSTNHTAAVLPSSPIMDSTATITQGAVRSRISVPMDVDTGAPYVKSFDNNTNDHHQPEELSLINTVISTISMTAPVLPSNSTTKKSSTSSGGGDIRSISGAESRSSIHSKTHSMSGSINNSSMVSKNKNMPTLISTKNIQKNNNNKKQIIENRNDEDAEEEEDEDNNNKTMDDIGMNEIVASNEDMVLATYISSKLQAERRNEMSSYSGSSVHSTNSKKKREKEGGSVTNVRAKSPVSQKSSPRSRQVSPAPLPPRSSIMNTSALPVVPNKKSTRSVRNTRSYSPITTQPNSVKKSYSTNTNRPSSPCFPVKEQEDFEQEDNDEKQQRIMSNIPSVLPRSKGSRLSSTGVHEQKFIGSSDDDQHHHRMMMGGGGRGIDSLTKYSSGGVSRQDTKMGVQSLNSKATWESINSPFAFLNDTIRTSHDLQYYTQDPESLHLLGTNHNSSYDSYDSRIDMLSLQSLGAW